METPVKDLVIQSPRPLLQGPVIQAAAPLPPLDPSADALYEGLQGLIIKVGRGEDLQDPVHLAAVDRAAAIPTADDPDVHTSNTPGEVRPRQEVLGGHRTIMPSERLRLEGLTRV